MEWSLCCGVAQEKDRMRFLLTCLVVLASTAPAHRTQCAPALERGAAITEPAALRELDHGRFGLRAVLLPMSSIDGPLVNKELFALPAMRRVRQAIDAEFTRYISRHNADLPNESIGVGSSYDFQLFDRALLDSPGARFMLAGIVNRMDRAYVNEAGCGEIRLIYRMTQADAAEAGEGGRSPRLPMTLNVVLKAKGDFAADGNGRPISCAEIAKRWLIAGDAALTGAALSQKLTAQDGPLDLVRSENIFRIETNLQIAHAPKSPVRDFRTDYLMKVFDYNPQSQAFVEARLENQIDRERILSDEKLKSEFRTWMFEPTHLAALDRGTILIPDKFLATAAIAPTPVGFSASNLQPAFGLVQRDDASSEPAFKQADISAALRKAADRGVTMQNIRSVAGFERRLNDITCAGCHQNRGIGGFHFPGVDWMAAKPDNATVVPASPHFLGDQVRRRDVLAAFRDGKSPDYSRGFSDRARSSAELAGTEYGDGWGAHCYVQRAKASDNDRSFRSWTCAKGLACQPLGGTSPIGMCFVENSR
jgi:hypothetical protein